MIEREKGKDLPIRRVSTDEYSQMMISAGLDELTVKIFISEFKGLQNGEAATISPTLEELLGRKPKTMEQVVHETLENSNWDNKAIVFVDSIILELYLTQSGNIL